jgi:hypothetical protein
VTVARVREPGNDPRSHVLDLDDAGLEERASYRHASTEAADVLGAKPDADGLASAL